MKVTYGILKGIILIQPIVFDDHRGFFLEAYNFERFQNVGVNNTFIQDNHSFSAEAGVIRGLHYQLNPGAQTKLVRVIAGAIYDVVVDIRKQSPTFGQWEGFMLSSENKYQLLVPTGFAHGFCTLTPNTEVLYKVDNYYSPAEERGIIWSDPALGIEWPIDCPILSEKDRNYPLLENAETNF